MKIYSIHLDFINLKIHQIHMYWEYNQRLGKTFGTVILDRTTRKILLSDAVILLSSALRDIPLFDLAEYEDIPIDEYNIEVIRPQNTLSFGKYYALLQYTSIPYILMLRSWILYNLYEEIKDGEGKVRYKLLEKESIIK